MESIRIESDISSHALDKTPENTFNFDIALDDRQSLTDKTISTAESCDKLSTYMMTDDLKIIYPEPTIHNLIINKLYNECNIDNNNFNLNGTKQFMCNNSCKCYVEVLKRKYENGYANNGDVQRKCIIKIEDCDCQRTTENIGVDEPSVLLFAENRGYDALITMSDCKKGRNQTRNRGENEHSINESNKKSMSKGINLRSEDLLSFAKQIASGMVWLN